MIKKILQILFFFFLIITQSCQKKREKKLSTFRVNICSEPSTLDPRKGGDLNSATVHFLLYEGLMRQEPNKKQDFGIAKSVTISDDGLTYTFTLKKAYWSNGNPITSYDFIQTFKDILSPTFPAPNAHLLYCIKNAEKAKKGLISSRHIGIRGINHKTFEIHLEAPTPSFLDILTFCSLCPINQNVLQSNSSYYSKKNYLVSNGPYRLVKYEHGRELILEKNPYYWDKSNVTLEQIVISIVDNPQTAFNLYEKGRLDYIGKPFTDLPHDISSHDNFKNSIQTGNLPGSTLLTYNLESKIFDNINIRKAFALSIDRNEFYYSLLNFTPKEKYISFFSKSLTDKPEDLFALSPQNSQALFYLNKGLKELGIKKADLEKIRLTHSNQGDYLKVAQLLQEQWAQNLGILLQLETLEHQAYLGKLYSKNFDLSLCCWIAQYLNKMNLFERFIEKNHAKNYPGLNNKDYINLIKQIPFAKTQTQIESIYNDLEAILVKDCAIIPLFHWQNQYMLQNCIQSFQLLPGGSICYKYIKTTNTNIS